MSNTSSNITIVNYYFTSTEKGFLIGTFGLTLILTLVGNLVVILVESISKKTSASIRAYHISMACADILLATFPFPVIFTNLLLSGWPHFFPPYFCPMARFMQSLGEMGSTLTLSCYALERCLVIWWPMSSRVRWVKSHPFVTLPLVWIIALGLSLRPAMKVRITRKFCMLERYNFITALYNLLIFLIPWLMLLGAYTAIFIKIVKRDRLQSSGTSSGKQTIKIMLIIVLTDCLWIPNMIYKLIRTLKIMPLVTLTDVERLSWFQIGVYWLTVLNSALNPWIYCLMSRTFRDRLRQVCKMKPRVSTS